LRTALAGHFEDITAVPTMEEPGARKVGKRETDGLASRVHHICQWLVRQRKIDPDPTWDGATVCPGELEKLLENTLGVTNICAVCGSSDAL
jgi:hypothetical protein